jgi:Zn-dependent protease
MRDPLTWAFPIGRFFGITVRVHLLFLFFTIVMVARGMADGYAGEALLVQVILFFSVLFHEFGHCFAARHVDGDATDILMWPLGGLAAVDVPHTPRANFITTAGGPAVNVLLCAVTGGALVACNYVPPLSPFWSVIAVEPLYNWSTGEMDSLARFGVLDILARVFWINWILFWFNILLVGFPLDGGRLLQAILWPSLGYHQATRIVVFTGWIIALLLGLYVFITFRSDPESKILLFALSLFIYTTCKQQFIILETGAEDSVFGYDFSQGYTSLERDTPPPRRPRRQNFVQRWLQRRAERRRARAEAQRAEEERRVDELLDKVQRSGMQSLTDEEQRFLKRVSAKYRHRNESQ